MRCVVSYFDGWGRRFSQGGAGIEQHLLLTEGTSIIECEKYIEELMDKDNLPNLQGSKPIYVLLEIEKENYKTIIFNKERRPLVRG
jgi:hypothetical protein